jgi:hypothetical protein
MVRQPEGLYQPWNEEGCCATRSTTAPFTWRISAFLLSLKSPVLHKNVCGCFIESGEKCVDVDPACFKNALNLWCNPNGVENESM